MKRKLTPFLATMLLAGCGQEFEHKISDENSVICENIPRGELSLVSAWVRPAPTGQRTSAVYFTLCNQTEQTKTVSGVSSDLAISAELHETTRDRDGVASMAPLGNLPIGPGEVVTLQPGGTHVMLIGLNEPIEVGDKIALTLTFSSGVAMEIEAEARTSPAAAKNHHSHH